MQVPVHILYFSDFDAAVLRFCKLYFFLFFSIIRGLEGCRRLTAVDYLCQVQNKNPVIQTSLRIVIPVIIVISVRYQISLSVNLQQLWHQLEPLINIEIVIIVIAKIIAYLPSGNLTISIVLIIIKLTTTTMIIIITMHILRYNSP